jgi:hypothetical protein
MSTLRPILLGILIASCSGCVMPWEQWRPPQKASDSHVLVCTGTAPFATCKHMNAEAYRVALRESMKQRLPPTGTRINPNARRSR